MAKKLPVQYQCEICGRVWDSLNDAVICEHSHNRVEEVVASFFEIPERFKYPSRIDCKMQDGEIVSYLRSGGKVWD